MGTYSVNQILGLGLFVIVFLDFIRSSARNGVIHFADFPVHLFILFGRVLDTIVALIFSLFTKNWRQLSLIKKTWSQTTSFLPSVNNGLDRNSEKEWINWGRQKCLILNHTLERSGAHIFVEKNKLPGQQPFHVSKNNPNTPVPKVKTLDFQIRYSAEHQEVHFVPQYFYGVDPSLRSAMRQRIDDGTLAVAFGVAARHVSFVERHGHEAIVVKVGETTVQKTSLPPPIPKAGKGPVVQQLVPEDVDLTPISKHLPPLTIFNRPKVKKQESRDTAEVVLQAFCRLNIGVDSSGASKFRHVNTVIGPAITQVIFLSSGLKISALTREGENIAAELGIQGSVRISAVPGMPGCFGVEVPNEQRGIVTLQEMVASPEFRQSKSALPLCIGVTIIGKPLIADLTKLPHLLVAGATNQGKSVGLNAMILSLVLRRLPSELKLIMVDPKAVELTVYEDLPHLLAPIATEPKEAIQLLNGMVSEMEARYSRLRSKKTRNIGEYNEKVPPQWPDRFRVVQVSGEQRVAEIARLAENFGQVTVDLGLYTGDCLDLIQAARSMIYVTDNQSGSLGASLQQTEHLPVDKMILAINKAMPSGLSPGLLSTQLDMPIGIMIPFDHCYGDNFGLSLPRKPWDIFRQLIMKREATAL
jgi:S-DNA-T family DNA segregation ATPase FtsK/SpoIIIE